jgi:hypothetical protein
MDRRGVTVTAAVGTSVVNARSAEEQAQAMVGTNVTTPSHQQIAMDTGMAVHVPSGIIANDTAVISNAGVINNAIVNNNNNTTTTNNHNTPQQLVHRRRRTQSLMTASSSNNRPLPYPSTNTNLASSTSTSFSSATTAFSAAAAATAAAMLARGHTNADALAGLLRRPSLSSLSGALQSSSLTSSLSVSGNANGDIHHVLPTSLADDKSNGNGNAQQQSNNSNTTAITTTTTTTTNSNMTPLQRAQQHLRQQAQLLLPKQLNGQNAAAVAAAVAAAAQRRYSLSSASIGATAPPSGTGSTPTHHRQRAVSASVAGPGAFALMREEPSRDRNGEVACRICGKRYKNSVCLQKHAWEHHQYVFLLILMFLSGHL